MEFTVKNIEQLENIANDNLATGSISITREVVGDGTKYLQITRKSKCRNILYTKKYDLDGSLISISGNKSAQKVKVYKRDTQKDFIILTGNELQMYKFLSYGFNSMVCDATTMHTDIKISTSMFKKILYTEDFNLDYLEGIFKLKISPYPIKLDSTLDFTLEALELACKASEIGFNSNIDIKTIFGKNTFFTVGTCGKTKDLKVELNTDKLRQYINELGFYYKEGDHKTSVVKLDGVYAKDVKSFDGEDDVLLYVANLCHERSAYYSENKNIKFILNEVARLLTNLQLRHAGSKFLKPKPVRKNLDTQHYSHIYTANAIHRIGKDFVQKVSPEDIDGYVDFSNIVNKTGIENFTWNGDINADTDSLDFVQCMRDSVHDFDTFKFAMGLFMSGYRLPSEQEIIFLTDNVLQLTKSAENGNNNKGIVVQFLEKIRNCFKKEDISKTSLKDKFLFSGVTNNTHGIIMEDVNKDVDYKAFKSLASGNFSLEKKGRDAIPVNTENVPRLLVTTNHAPKNEDKSDDKRVFILGFKFPYEVATERHFGREFFNDYEEKDWQLVYSFAAQCLQFYFQNQHCKLKYTKNAPEDIKANQLLQATSEKWVSFLKVGIPFGKMKLSEIKFLFVKHAYPYLKEEDIPAKIDDNVIIGYLNSTYRTIGFFPETKYTGGGKIRAIGIGRTVQTRNAFGEESQEQVFLFGNTNSQPFLQKRGGAYNVTTRANYSREDCEAYVARMGAFCDTIDAHCITETIGDTNDFDSVFNNNLPTSSRETPFNNVIVTNKSEKEFMGFNTSRTTETRDVVFVDSKGDKIQEILSMKVPF